ncbi:MAG TPA: twin-arginine translocase TatA/TatE family subunit, partial [Candidatus Acidoferrum sp.]|nr:twin-arginine translocase TatA/TatE family subunit [Candidatus Acidoferrum sp.]
WIIVIAVFVLLFGGRKIPELMKGLGQGIREFKQGMAGDTTQAAPPAPQQPAAPVNSAPVEQKK